MDSRTESYRQVIADLRQLSYFAARDGDAVQHARYETLWRELHTIHPHPFYEQEAGGAEPGEVADHKGNA